MSSGLECVLKKLTDTRLTGALPGLTVSTYDLQLSEKNFTCCGGTGSRLIGDGKDASRCDLRIRTMRVAALVKQFRELWGPEAVLPTTLTASDLDDLARRLDRKTFAQQKGRSLARKAPAQGPSPLWAIAFAAVWRFGYEVHVASIKRTPWQNLTHKNAGSPLIVIVEGIDALWDVRRADELEFVVGWAYQARAQLWCDWLLHLPPEAEDRRRPASNRIARSRGKSPFNWLNADMHSKLSFLTDGLDPIIRWPLSRAKPGPGTQSNPSMGETGRRAPEQSR